VCNTAVVQYDCDDVLLERDGNDKSDAEDGTSQENADARRRSAHHTGKDGTKAIPLYASAGCCSTVHLSTVVFIVVVFAPASAFCFISPAISR